MNRSSTIAVVAKGLELNTFVSRFESLQNISVIAEFVAVLFSVLIALSMNVVNSQKTEISYITAWTSTFSSQQKENFCSDYDISFPRARATRSTNFSSNPDPVFVFVVVLEFVDRKRSSAFWADFHTNSFLRSREIKGRSTFISLLRAVRLRRPLATGGAVAGRFEPSWRELT